VKRLDLESYDYRYKNISFIVIDKNRFKFVNLSVKFFSDRCKWGSGEDKKY